MIVAKDVKLYLANNYDVYLEPVSELSKSDSGKILVNDERKLYNFDKITEKFYPYNKPESADAIYATDKRIILVEYKSGFKKKITKSNFDKKRMSCPDDEDKEKYCEHYANLFFKNQEQEDNVLKKSLQMKAVESYMTLMKEIVFKSKPGETELKQSLLYCVVIDDSVERMEDILNMSANIKSDTNIIARVRDSLGRFRKNSNKDYYYDNIEVFTPNEFKKFMDQNMP